MIRLLKNRYALATVITTLIILVVAILLAGVVTYFAINVVSTRVQQESLFVSQAHIWVPATAAGGAAIARLAYDNEHWRTRRRHQQIAIRGQDAHGHLMHNLVYSNLTLSQLIPLPEPKYRVNVGRPQLQAALPHCRSNRRNWSHRFIPTV